MVHWYIGIVYTGVYSVELNRFNQGDWEGVRVYTIVDSVYGIDVAGCGMRVKLFNDQGSEG